MIKEKLEDLKTKTEEMQDEFSIQIHQMKSEKSNLECQIEILKSQFEYEIQQKQTELASIL